MLQTYWWKLIVFLHVLKLISWLNVEKIPEHCPVLKDRLHMEWAFAFLPVLRVAGVFGPEKMQP